MIGASALAFDSAVPYRDVLLDGGTMRSRLAAYLGGSPEHVRPIRVKYRVGESLRVVYRVAARNRQLTLAARTFADAERAAMIAAANDRNAVFASMPGVFDAPDLGAVFWVFPNDRRLPGLQALLTPAPELAADLGGMWVSSRLVAYVPEKGAVVACLDSRDRVFAYAKLHSSGDEAGRAGELHGSLAAMATGVPDLNVPALVHVDPARRVSVVESAPGARLTDLDAWRWPGALHLLGKAVARFHGLEPPASAPPRVPRTDTRFQNAANVIGAVRPSLKREGRILANTLCASRPASTPSVLLHADLHLKNALLSEDRLWLIDLDQASTGAAAADLGSFLALLRSQVIAGLMPASQFEALAGSFLDGYAAIDALPDAATLAWHTAAALLEERAVRAIARMRLPLLEHLDRLIADAQSLLWKGRTS